MQPRSIGTVKLTISSRPRAMLESAMGTIYVARVTANMCQTGYGEVCTDPWQVVCWACGTEHAPDRIAALSAFYGLVIDLAIKLSTTDTPLPCVLSQH